MPEPCQRQYVRRAEIPAPDALSLRKAEPVKASVVVYKSGIGSENRW